MSTEKLKNNFLRNGDDDFMYDSCCADGNFINELDFNNSEEQKGYFDLHDGRRNSNNNESAANKCCKDYNHFLKTLRMTVEEVLESTGRDYIIIH